MYDVTHGNMLKCEIVESNPQESFHSYPSAEFTLNLARKQGYYLYNIILPMGMITAFTAVSIGVEESSGEKISTGNRVQITLTLLLTSVAFKFVVADSLPTISYQTTLDKYILICNGFISLAIFENVLYPALAYDNKKRKPVINEWYLMLIFSILFLFFNIYFWVSVSRGFKKRRKLEIEKGNETIDHTDTGQPKRRLSDGEL
jgi:hypothetical protein